MIGFDIGGTKCAVTLGKKNGNNLEITDKRFLYTDNTVSPYDMIEKLCNAAREMTDNIDVVGISCGGPLDSQRGIILSPPNLPGWDDIHIVDYVEKELLGSDQKRNKPSIKNWFK